MRKRNRKWLLCLVTTICLLCCGCGTGRTKVSETKGVDMTEYQRDFHNRKVIDIVSQSWKKPGKRKDAENFWGIGTYKERMIPLYDREPEKYTMMGRYNAAQGKDCYILNQYWIYENFDVDNVIDNIVNFTDRRYSLTHVDAETLETSSVLCESFYMEKGPLQGAVVSAMDCQGEEVYLLMETYDKEDGSVQHCYAVSLDMEGKLTILLDLRDTLKSCGLLQEAYAKPQQFHFDSQGYYYILSEDSGTLIILDEKGTLVEAAACGDILEDASHISFCFKSPEGRCVWRAESSGQETEEYFTYDKGARKELLQTDRTGVDPGYLNSYGDVYGISGGNQICCWNISTGENECIYRNSNDDLQSVIMISQNDRGELVLIKEDSSENCYLAVYSPGERMRDVTISLYSCDFCDAGTVLDQVIKGFEQRHPGVHIEATYAAGTAEEQDGEWVKIATEMGQGKGPDLLYIPRMQLKSLAAKNALLKLDDVLEEELREQIYPAVLEYGEIDDTLYGATFSGGYETVLVSNEVWSDKKWTGEDVLSLLQEREGDGLPYAGVCNDMYSNDGLTAEDMLQFFLEGIAESPYVDLQRGICDFRCDGFLELLRTCRKYGKPVPQRFVNDEETRLSQYEAVQEGKLLGYSVFRYNSDFVQFSESMARFGNNCHPVGFPTQGESGSYFVGDYTMAVNKNAGEHELIRELLNYLYSFEVQMKTYRMPVRKDFLEAIVMEQVGWSEDSFLHIPGERAWIKLVGKPDGTTYLQEYLELMDSCVARPDIVEEISAIAKEEAMGYFYGSKSPEAVADIIQSRVSLLLQENK